MTATTTPLQTILVGQPVFIRVRLTDPATGDPNDPTTQDPVDDPTIGVTVYKPDGTTDTPSMQHVDTGTYTGSTTPDQAGKFEIVSTAASFAAGAGRTRFHASAYP